MHDLEPASVPVDLVDRLESLVDVRCRGDQRDALPDGAFLGDPVEGISPAEAGIVRAAGLEEHVQEMDGSPIVGPVPGQPRHLGESHGVMRVRDGETHRFPEKTACGRHERLEEDHGTDRERADERGPVVELFGPTAGRPGVEALVIVGRLSIRIQPADEPVQGLRPTLAAGPAVIPGRPSREPRLPSNRALTISFQLLHLFLPVESYELRGDGPVLPEEGLPDITGQEDQAAEQVGPSCPSGRGPSASPRGDGSPGRNPSARSRRER